MLRATVSLSRKISRDYNSTGYTVSLDGEIPFQTSDSEGVLEKVNELFNLAQEALNVEIDRDQGNDAIGRRDQEPPKPTNNGHTTSGNTTNGYAKPNTPPAMTNRTVSSNGNNTGSPDAATPKQIQFLQSMAKRHKLNDRQLENRISDVLGRTCGINQLNKKEAGLVLDTLTNGTVRTGA